MWEIYDALIEGIPKNFITDELICGKHDSYIRSGSGSGIASSRPYETRMPMFTKNLIGLPLRDVATCVKSWNFMEASIGAAAINAYYNNPQVARDNGVMFSDSKRVEDRKFDPFIMSQNEVKGKKVAVVGHFPHIESLFEPICDFSIIEWDPEDSDYPMSACEFLLPECDYVYLTCTSIVDKTLPRLLELSKNAKLITVVGPGTPLAPVLFNYGIGDLSGFIIKDNLRALRIAAGAEKLKIATAGQKVAFKK
ncbi:protein of unknown function (DUF4213/DUF364 family) [Sporomusaceae bacterium BoRhaA]|uniref:DUF364 domain-containing protein n=1 Tax=Pelorhabdus rhamnosifermentans TaxID=2772457 RepID=UPI001C063019|nr:DUF364 domain-containing protein [Pelorhabdus rhamnosifermentans]MBU2703485.1 protein of unknown function (DUF4213/DUF364 family) [Pelorhabdus rhamnosifermentans]